MLQATSSILLVRPANFGYNSQTAVSNSFQQQLNLPLHELNKKVADEFENFITTLKAKGVNVFVVDDTIEPIKPDAIFPNNWVSFHEDGTVVLYPMCTPNRRLERRMDVVDSLKEKFKFTRVIDLSEHEKNNRFLEGTGSIVFDHEHKIAYACLSPRTDKEILIDLAKKLDYEACYFTAYDKLDKEIYHTNVMMCIGSGFAIVCLDCIKDHLEKNNLINKLNSTGHEIIAVSNEQINQFAGNMLFVDTHTKQKILICSQSAFNSLEEGQKEKINKYCELVAIPIPTIETIGGGSARCMMAEIFS